MAEERYKNGFTISVYIPPEAPKETVDRLIDEIDKVVHGPLLEDRGQWDPFLHGRAGDVLQVDRDGHDCCPPHVYLSTSCFHNDHNYCKSERGLIGNKTPAVCKFCSAPCVCMCHQEKEM